MVKFLMYLGKFEKNIFVQIINENLNDSGIQFLKVESDEVDECFMIYFDDGKDKIKDFQLRFCFFDDNESNFESAENGWDSGFNFLEEIKLYRVLKYILVDNRKDLLEVFEIKIEGDKYIFCENMCDFEIERRDFQSVYMELLDGKVQFSFFGIEDDDNECLVAMIEEFVDLEKVKGNLSLLEQVIVLQVE